MRTSNWRINPVAIISAGMALSSIFLPWWGIYRLFGPNAILFRQWSLWNPPGTNTLGSLGRPHPLSATTISQVFTLSSLIVLMLVLVVAAFALAGGITLLRKSLVGGLMLSVLTPVVYAVGVTYVTANFCLLSPLCASGPVGTGTVFGTTFIWGFETGFFIFVTAIVVLGLSVVLNNSLTKATTSRERSDASKL